jgi:hypothetical protein
MTLLLNGIHRSREREATIGAWTKGLSGDDMGVIGHAIRPLCATLQQAYEALLSQFASPACRPPFERHRRWNNHVRAIVAEIDVSRLAKSDEISTFPLTGHQHVPVTNPGKLAASGGCAPVHQARTLDRRNWRPSHPRQEASRYCRTTAIGPEPANVADTATQTNDIAKIAMRAFGQ